MGTAALCNELSRLETVNWAARFIFRLETNVSHYWHLAKALLLFRLCNCLLAGTTKASIDKLQHIMNVAAAVVSC